MHAYVYNSENCENHEIGFRKQDVVSCASPEDYAPQHIEENLGRLYNHIDERGKVFDVFKVS